MRSRCLILLILPLCLSLAACGPDYHTLANFARHNQGPIVCLGDSITFGLGARPDQSYPAQLQQMLNVPVINAGVSGDTTADALARLERDVFPHAPRLVIVAVGGNDFLRQVPREEVFANLDRIVQRVTEAGSMAVLVHTKFGLFTDPYFDGYEAVAEKRGALLVSNSLKGILANPKRMSDQIHPNAAGYRLLAERIAEAVQPLLDAAETAAS